MNESGSDEREFSIPRYDLWEDLKWWERLVIYLSVPFVIILALFILVLLACDSLIRRFGKNGLKALAAFILILSVMTPSYIADADTPTGYAKNGDILTLHNNAFARPASWSEINEFVTNDDTNELPYRFPEWVCWEYSLQLHDRAESNGIRAGVVVLDLQNIDGTHNPGHVLNIFATSDHGLVYVDNTMTERVGRVELNESYWTTGLDDVDILGGNYWDANAVITGIHTFW
jgi:hypothetical protein